MNQSFLLELIYGISEYVLKMIDLENDPIVHLCRFLAETIIETELVQQKIISISSDFDTDIMKILVDEWPRLQGISSRNMLYNISKQDIDLKKVAEGLKILANK